METKLAHISETALGKEPSDEDIYEIPLRHLEEKGPAPGLESNVYAVPGSQQDETSDKPSIKIGTERENLFTEEIIYEVPRSQTEDQQIQDSSITSDKTGGGYKYHILYAFLILVAVTCSTAAVAVMVLHVTNTNSNSVHTQQIFTLVKRMGNLSAEHNTSIEQIHKLDREPKNYINGFRNQLNQTNQKIQVLEAQQNAVSQKMRTIHDQICKAKERIQVLEAQQSVLNSTIHSVQEHIHQTIEKIWVLEAKQNTLNTTTFNNSQLQKDNDNLNKLQNRASSELVTQRQVLSALENETGYELQTIGTLARDYQALLEFVTNSTVSVPNPLASCKDIPEDNLAGEYWIQAENTSFPVLVYCDNNPRNCSCNSSAGGWMRVANIDMTDPSQECPPGFRLINRTTAPHRTCGRPGDSAGCVSTTFPVYGIEYSRVCGRVIGYQLGTPNAFQSDYVNLNTDGRIDTYYIDGISLTHGQSPRKHIWSFVCAVSEAFPSSSNYFHDINICPCTRAESNYRTDIPQMSFINGNYFCDTALEHTNWMAGFFYPDDPLWDGQGCGSTSSCCSFNNPPWFCTQLPQATTDDIELRVCNNQGISQDDTPFEIAEIYIN